MRFDNRKVCRRLAEIRRVRFHSWKRSFGECVLTTSKCVGSLQSFGNSVYITGKRVKECIFTARKSVGGLHSFGECVLTTSKSVGGLQRYGLCILSTARRVVGLYSFGECVLITARLAKLCRMRFDTRKACWRLV